MDKKKFIETVNYGMIVEEQALCLLDLLDKLKTDLPIVEIGVYNGGTTRLLALYLKEIGKSNLVIGIDPFDRFIRHEVGTAYPIGQGTYKKALDSTKGLNVQIIPGFSFDPEVLKQVEAASLIFHDGDHHYEETKLDIELWVPKAKEYFVMHDAELYPEVKQALDDSDIEYDIITYDLASIKVGYNG